MFGTLLFLIPFQAPWFRVLADRVQVDAAGVIDTGGRALNGIPQNAPDSPAAGTCRHSFDTQHSVSFVI